MCPLTVRGPPLYIDAMEKGDGKGIIEAELASLERWLDELMRTCHRLKEENRSLREQQQVLTAERAGLIQKNELARSRIEAMITQLRSMEHGT